jgi:hypothetical protein
MSRELAGTLLTVATGIAALAIPFIVFLLADPPSVSRARIKRIKFFIFLDLGVAVVFALPSVVELREAIWPPTWITGFGPVPTITSVSLTSLPTSVAPAIPPTITTEQVAVAPTEPVVPPTLTTVPSPAPTVTSWTPEELQPVLLTKSDLGDVLDPNDNPTESGRGYLLQPELLSLCDVATPVSSSEVGADVNKDFDTYHSRRVNVGTEVTVFYGSGADEFMSAVRGSARACNGNEWPLGMGDESEAMWFDVNGEFLDRVFIRRGNIVIQVALLTDDGGHLVTVRRIAAECLKRLDKLMAQHR